MSCDSTTPISDSVSPKIFCVSVSSMTMAFFSSSLNGCSQQQACSASDESGNPSLGCPLAPSADTPSGSHAPRLVMAGLLLPLWFCVLNPVCSEHPSLRRMRMSHSVVNTLKRLISFICVGMFACMCMCVCTRMGTVCVCSVFRGQKRV